MTAPTEIAKLRAYADNFTNLMHAGNRERIAINAERLVEEIDGLVEQITTLEDRLEAVRFGGAR